MIGLFSYVYFFINSYNKFSKNHFLLFAIVCFFFVSSLLIKNHDDFSYYHFAYTYFLTQQSSLFGIGIFNICSGKRLNLQDIFLKLNDKRYQKEVIINQNKNKTCLNTGFLYIAL